MAARIRVHVCAYGAVLLIAAASLSAFDGDVGRSYVSGDPHAVVLKGLSPRLWADRLASRDRSIRRRAMRQLVDGGETALPMLAALLRSRNPAVWQRAGEALGRLGPAALPFVVELVGDVDAVTRYHALNVIGSLAPESAAAVEALARRLDDPDSLVASEAAWALAALRKHAAG